MSREAAPADAESVITDDDIARFGDAIVVRDPTAFRAVLSALIVERVVARTALQSAANAPDRRPPLPGDAAQSAAPTYVSSDEAFLRQREARLRDFDRPHNLPLTEFARLARKSRQQVYKDIHAGRLLALHVGTRGRRLPDWQLDAAGLRLTQAVLTRSAGDTWEIYHALTDPLNELDGCPPARAVRPDNVETLANLVLAELGARPPPAKRA